MVAVALLLVLYTTSAIACNRSPLRLLPQLQTIGAAAWLLRIYRHTDFHTPVLYDSAANDFYGALSILHGASPWISPGIYHADAGELLERTLILASAAFGCAISMRAALIYGQRTSGPADPDTRIGALRNFVERSLIGPRLELCALSIAALPCFLAVVTYLTELRCCKDDMENRYHRRAWEGGMMEAILAMSVPVFVLGYLGFTVIESHAKATFKPGIIAGNKLGFWDYFGLPGTRWSNVEVEAKQTATSFIFHDDDTLEKSSAREQVGFVEMWGHYLEPVRGRLNTVLQVSPRDRSGGNFELLRRLPGRATASVHTVWIAFVLRLLVVAACSLGGGVDGGNARNAGAFATTAGLLVASEAVGVALLLPYHAAADNAVATIAASFTAMGFFTLAHALFDDAAETGSTNESITIAAAFHAFAVTLEGVALLMLVIRDIRTLYITTDGCMSPAAKTARIHAKIEELAKKAREMPVQPQTFDNGWGFVALEQAYSAMTPNSKMRLGPLPEMQAVFTEKPEQFDDSEVSSKSPVLSYERQTRRKLNISPGAAERKDKLMRLLSDKLDFLEGSQRESVSGPTRVQGASELSEPLPQPPKNDVVIDVANAESPLFSPPLREPENRFPPEAPRVNSFRTSAPVTPSRPSMSDSLDSGSVEIDLGMVVDPGTSSASSSLTVKVPARRTARNEPKRFEKVRSRPITITDEDFVSPPPAPKARESSMDSNVRAFKDAPKPAGRKR